MIGRTVGIGGVSACGIENSTITIKKIAAKHNYLVTVIRVDRDEVPIETLVDSCLEQQAVWIEWIFGDPTVSSMSVTHSP